MKAILEFNMHDVDDQFSYHACIEGKEMALSIFELENYLRRCDKDDLPIDAEEIRDLFRGIDIDRMVQ